MRARPVQLPRSAAVKLARFERDSLRVRARASASCAPLWSDAAQQADRIVRFLEAGRDTKAASAALLVGPKWKRAAKCEGLTAPARLGNPGARDGEVNFSLFDRYTVAHYATGIGLGVMRLKWWQALIFAVGWEIVESPLKRAIPKAFPYSSEDTLTNAAGDVLGMMAGWGTWKLIDKAATR